MNKIEYVQGADLPDAAFNWYDTTGALINFSAGWTFQLKVGHPGETALFTKTTGFTGSAASPNFIISWNTAGELNTLPPGIYRGQVKATRTVDNRERFMLFDLIVDAAVL